MPRHLDWQPCRENNSNRFHRILSIPQPGAVITANQMSAEEDPKIIVDDDWKTQVEKEKAMAAGKSDPGQDDSQVDASAATTPDTPPPATLETLVSMLFTQALAALGQIPGPDGKPNPVNKSFAKYFIDSLEMLGEKTKGNLSDDESTMISETLHAMRMAFVSVKGK